MAKKLSEGDRAWVVKPGDNAGKWKVVDCEYEGPASRDTMVSVRILGLKGMERRHYPVAEVFTEHKDAVNHLTEICTSEIRRAVDSIRECL